MNKIEVKLNEEFEFKIPGCANHSRYDMLISDSEMKNLSYRFDINHDEDFEADAMCNGYTPNYIYKFVCNKQGVYRISFNLRNLVNQTICSDLYVKEVVVL